MKKRLLLSLILVLSIGFSSNVMAADYAEDAYEQLIGTIEKNSDMNGGLYFKDGVLHIVPTMEKESQLEAMTKGVKNIGINYIVDEPVLYTAAELEEAFLKLRENRDSLDITSYAINYEKNEITITAAEWSESEKEEIYGLLGIENIGFVSEGHNVRFDEYLEATDNELISPQVDELTDLNNSNTNPLARLGNRMNWEARPDPSYTIGRAVEDSSGNIYFVTAGHGLAVNDEMYFETIQDPDTGNYVNGLMGIVDRVSTTNGVDAALVESNGRFLPTTLTKNGTSISSDGDARQGGYVNVWTNRGPILGSIVYPSIDVSWDGEWFEQAIDMIFETSAVTQGGDSGACISMYTNGTSGSQKYVGIYKGQKTMSDNSLHIFGTNRALIEDAFNITTY